MTEKAAVNAALQANKAHQNALRVYVERLEAELETVDKMMEEVDSEDDAEDIQENSLIYVEGAAKPVSVVLTRALLSEDSPFFEDAQWKKRYDEFTTVNQMKAKEHDALREAMRVENMRMQALAAQNRGQSIDLKSFPPEYFEQNTEGIDWRRVSVKMNSLISSASPRTPKECEIRWLGHLHPSVNNGPWTPEETGRLRNILDEEGPEESPSNWVDISERLGMNRTPIDCMRHGMTRRIHTWSPEADRKLLEAVELYGQNNWQLVAMSVSEDATAHQCQKRYLNSLGPSIKNGPWTAEEDKQLRRAITAFAGEAVFSVNEDAKTSGTGTGKGKQPIPWPDVALFVPGRTNNQCREHYQDCLVESKKGTGGKGKKGKLGSTKSVKGKGEGKGKEKAIVMSDSEEDAVESDGTAHAEEAKKAA